MEMMYSNRITLTVNDKEAFFTFDLVTPKLDENRNVVSDQVAESKAIIMSRETLIKVRGLIDDCLTTKSEKA